MRFAVIEVYRDTSALSEGASFHCDGQRGYGAMFTRL
jgi:hypothetical protein